MDRKISSLPLAKIRKDGGTQSRAAILPAYVAELVEALQTVADLPPVVVFHDGSNYWLADGFHRLAAYVKSEKKHIFCDVRQGTRRDAILYSVGANAAHGLRRTNADKRRAVETLVNDDEWGAWTDRDIARRCGVGHQLVATVRAESGKPQPERRTFMTRLGTVGTYPADRAKPDVVATLEEMDRRVFAALPAEVQQALIEDVEREAHEEAERLDREAAAREAKPESATRTVVVKLPPEAAAILDGLCERLQESPSEVVERGLRELVRGG